MFVSDTTEHVDELVGIVADICKRLTGRGVTEGALDVLVPIIMTDLRQASIDASLEMINDTLEEINERAERSASALERIAAAFERAHPGLAQPKAGDWDARVQAHHDQFWNIYGDQTGAAPMDPESRNIEGLPHGDVRGL